MRPLSFDFICDRLAAMELPAADVVVGIASGGTVPAALTAQKLGLPLRMMALNFRDESNTPRFSSPQKLDGQERLRFPGQNVLLVDDVSVSGATLEQARKFLEAASVYTFVFKGKADYVLLPEISECVQWPWKTAPHGEISAR